jgi:hypothetical protein
VGILTREKVGQDFKFFIIRTSKSKVHTPLQIFVSGYLDVLANIVAIAIKVFQVSFVAEILEAFNQFIGGERRINFLLLLKFKSLTT